MNATLGLALLSDFPCMIGQPHTVVVRTATASAQPGIGIGRGLALAIYSIL